MTRPTCFLRVFLTIFISLMSGCNDGTEGSDTSSESPSSMDDIGVSQTDGRVGTEGTDGTVGTSDVSVEPQPRITAVRIRPEDPRVSDALECEWDFVDPQGGEDQSTVQWFIGDTPVDTGTTLAAGFRRDDIVRCEVTPSSNGENGAAVSQEVTIRNTAPSIDGVTLTPEIALEATVLTCTPGQIADADLNDTPTAVISWEINGALIDASENTLSGADFDRGDEVICIATPSDGDLNGDAERSNPVTIGNTPPSVSEVRFTPAMPRSAEAVTCMYTFTDADGNTDNSAVRWTLNGEPAGDMAIFDGHAVEGDVLTCTVEPWDGTDTGASVTIEITVANTLPSIESVVILPGRDTFTDEELTCQAQDVVDPDPHQELTYVYTWRVNDEPVNDVDDSRLSGAFFSRGDRVVCTVTVLDTFGASEPSHSDPKVIANSPPSLASVSITPRRPRPNDPLTCTYAGFSDADGDADASRTQWLINGRPVDGPPLNFSDIFEADDEVTCEVTPFDGLNEGASLRAQVTIEPFTVLDASIECLNPELGAMVVPDEAGDVALQGTVSEIFAVTGLTVDGQAVELSDDGSFETRVSADWGQNVHWIAIQDAFGNTQDTLCSYFAAPEYALEDDPIEGGVVVDFTDTAIDDGDDARPVSSLADLMRLRFTSERLTTSIHENLEVANPLMPENCLQDTVFGCIVTMGIEYVDVRVEEASIVSMTPVNDGLRLRAVVRNIRLNLQGSGTIEFPMQVEIPEIMMNLRSRGSVQNGHLGNQIDPVDTAVSELQFTVDIPASEYNGRLQSVAESTVVPIRRALEDELENAIRDVWDSLSNVTGVSEQISVPRFGVLRDVVLSRDATTFARVDTNPDRLQLSFSTVSDVQGVPLERVSAGIPLTASPRAVNAAHGSDMGLAIKAAVINQLLHALWRGRFFELGAADEFILNRPEGMELDISLHTPPAVRLIERANDTPALEFHLGPLVGRLIPDMENADAPRIRTVAVMHLGTTLVDSDDRRVLSVDAADFEFVRFQQTVDGLSEAAEGLDGLEEDLRALTQTLAQQSLTHILSGISNPEFPIAEDIPEVGGRHFGLREQTLDTNSAYLRLQGRMSE